MEFKLSRLFRKLRINKSKVIGLIVALVIALLSFIFLRDSQIFYFILGIAFVIAGLPFFIGLIIDGGIERKKEQMFLEFARDLVENVKAGTPISRSILNVRNKDYNVLNSYVDKLANQISLGISIQTSLNTFARDLRSPTINRSVTIISESEKAGGKIEEILESVVTSVSQIGRLKKQRRAAMYNLAVQGYIIFMIFIVIMIVMQYKVLPIAAKLGGDDGGIIGGSGGMPLNVAGLGMGEVVSPEKLAEPFIYLLLVQGFFAGLVIGKLSEGEVKAGIKHSFILVVLALLVSTGAKAFIGGAAVVATGGAVG
jgi:archaeal flagellar protein FlaJ